MCMTQRLRLKGLGEVKSLKLCKPRWKLCEVRPGAIGVLLEALMIPARNSKESV